MEAPRALRSLGLRKFIDEYEFWASRPARDCAIEYQLSRKFSNEAGAIMRASAAKKIFSQPELLYECLDYAVNHATKITEAQREKAKQYLYILKS